mgnify:CR=1 FL=1|uniref:Protein kinase domain-containing protein n=1 Tax=viral metagenome TaxID=1070528 RepID=A0A6C0J808_9ZZZZ
MITKHNFLSYNYNFIGKGDQGLIFSIENTDLVLKLVPIKKDEDKYKPKKLLKTFQKIKQVEEKSDIKNFVSILEYKNIFNVNVSKNYDIFIDRFVKNNNFRELLKHEKKTKLITLYEISVYNYAEGVSLLKFMVKEQSSYDKTRAIFQSIIMVICYLDYMNKSFKTFSHGDLDDCNILIGKCKKRNFIYKLNEDTLFAFSTNIKITIIDNFDISLDDTKNNIKKISDLEIIISWMDRRSVIDSDIDHSKFIESFYKKAKPIKVDRNKYTIFEDKKFFVKFSYNYTPKTRHRNYKPNYIKSPFEYFLSNKIFDPFKIL